MIDTREVRVDLGDHGVLGIPYVNVVGEAGDGPHLTVIAGVHGTEYTSIAAARELLAELRPAELSGTVTVAPLINLRRSGRAPRSWSRSTGTTSTAGSPATPRRRGRGNVKAE